MTMLATSTALPRAALAGACILALALSGCGSSSPASSTGATTPATSPSPASTSSMTGMTGMSPSDGMSGMGGTASASATATSPAGGASASPSFASTHLSHLDITQGYVFATSSGMTSMGAAYVTVHNAGPAATALTGVTTPAARMAMLHVTTDNGSGGGTMKEVSSLPVAAGQTLELAPGGSHIMLMGLAHPLAAGTTIPMTLRFRDGEQVSLTMPVIDRSQRPGA